MVSTLAPYIDKAHPEDASALRELLWSRPAECAATFEYVPEGYWLVVRDSEGVSGFLVLHWDEKLKALVLDQIECEYSLGKPTERGRAAYDLLAAETFKRADALECDCLATVNIHNRACVINLLSQGFEKETIVMRRKAVGQCTSP